MSPADQPVLSDGLSADSLGFSDSKEPVTQARWSPVMRHLLNFALGLLAAQAAVLLRFWLKIPTDVLPFFLVVIAVCLITVQAGLVGGITTMIAGGLLTWYYLLDPTGSWTLDSADEFSLLGYFSVSGVILATSQLYRLSEQKRQAVALELARQEARHQALFAREMSHRLKNAMAIVQAMASQTFTGDTPEVGKFNGRLMALADAHNLLNEHVKQPTASVAEVVDAAIRPFRDTQERFRVAGSETPLPDQQVVSLAIALHELGTNAVKYGALSKAEGWVSVDWTDADGRLQLEWKEHDGPPVKAPTSKGFGSRLLARAAMGTELHFDPDGLRCVFTSRI